MEVNDWFNKEFKNIESWSKLYHKDYGDLISYYYLYLSKPKNWTKFNKLDTVDKIKFSKAWLRNTAKWNGQFTKLKVNNLPETFDIPEEQCNDHLYIEISAEECDDNVKEWLIDLRRQFNDTQVDKLVMMRMLYISEDLDITEKILYDSRYKDNLTYRGISKKFHIPLTTVYLLSKQLDEKIKEKLCVGMTSTPYYG